MYVIRLKIGMGEGMVDRTSLFYFTFSRGVSDGVKGYHNEGL